MHTSPHTRFAAKHSMSEQSDSEPRKSALDQLRSNWGSLLFYGTLVASLVFFWWLLIHSGGVTIHHG